MNSHCPFCNKQLYSHSSSFTQTYACINISCLINNSPKFLYTLLKFDNKVDLIIFYTPKYKIKYNFYLEEIHINDYKIEQGILHFGNKIILKIFEYPDFSNLNKLFNKIETWINLS